MNLFKVMTLAAPIFGAIGGGTALKNSGTLTTKSGIIIGFGIGIGVIASTRFLSGWLSKHKQSKTMERSRWIASLLVVFIIPMLLPVLALLLSHFIVSAGLHL